MPSYQLHHFLAFTAIPGSLLRDEVGAKCARRMSEPMSPEAPCDWLDVTANNFGFFSPHDYPCLAVNGNESPYIIGVFGGSAAHWFALQAGAAIADEFDATQLLGRRPLVLNCAIGGMKQPQTLLTLNWLLTEGQRFDAAVVIDGFNEAGISYLNYERGYRPNAPSIQHLTHLTDNLGPYELPAGMIYGERDAVAKIGGHWARSSRLFHDVCHSQGIRVLQLLQPNQYYSDKSFSFRERRRALSRTSPYRAGVELVYPLLAEYAAELAAQGYDVVNALDAFDHMKETVYWDNCCHFNLRGNLVLKDIVLAALSSVDSATATPPDPSDRPPAVIASDITRRSAADAPENNDDALYPMW